MSGSAAFSTSNATCSASVSFDDGESVELGPGSVVRLRAGEHTTWVVRETLRKIYVA